MDSNQDFGSVLNNNSGSVPTGQRQNSGDSFGSLLTGYDQARTQPTRSVTDSPVGGGNVDEFVKSVAPAAQKVAQRLNVPVEAVIGQWGVETGWGKSVIPGTNNLGNIKDMSGKGVDAKDNYNGKTDKYRQYGSVDEFADDFTNLLSTSRYKSVTGSRDAESYFRNLQASGYAEHPQYVQTSTKASSMAAEVLKRAGVAQKQQQDNAPDLSKAPKWADVQAKPEFAKLPPEKQAEAKAAYFDYWIAPRAGDRAGELRQQFLAMGQKAEPGLMDKVGDAMNSVRDFAAGVGDSLYSNPNKSVMDGAAPAPELATTSKVPARPEVRAAFNAAWDAASPEERAQMQSKEGWTGMLARERAGVFEQSDANATPTTGKLDPRTEARARALVAKGEDPRFAERAAREAAAAGVMPGREIDFMQKGGGLAQKSEFDFDTKQLFDQQGGSNGLNNPLARGVAKAGLGITKAVSGYGQFMSEVYGLDNAAATAKAGGEWARGKENAIGESGSFMERNFEGAISSIGQQLPLMLGGAKLGAEAIPLAGMAVSSFGQEYSDGRSQGQSVGEATTRAGIFAAFEVIGEKFGLGDTLKAIKAAARGMPSDQIIGFLWSALKKEVPGELLTTTGQFATDKLPGGVGLNPNATGADYLKQVADTIAQTIMQSGVMAGGTTGVSNAVRTIRDNGPSIGVAAADAELAKQQALNKWNTNGLSNRIEPTLTSTPNVASVTPDGRIEPTMGGDQTVMPAEPAGAPAVHPTSQTADDIVRELAQQHGIPESTVLPTTAVSATTDQTSDQDVQEFASSRYQQLREKRDGSTQTTVGETGIVDQDMLGAGLSPAEQQELNGLQRAGNDPAALRALYGFDQITDPVAAATTEPGLIAAQEDNNVQTQGQDQATGPALDQGAVVPTGQPSGPAPIQEPAGQAPAAQSEGVAGEQLEGVPAQDSVTPAPQGQFATADEAKKYISAQRRASSAKLPKALPIPYPDGTFGLATEGSEGWADAVAYDKARAPKTEREVKKQRAEESADERTKSGYPIIKVGRKKLAVTPFGDDGTYALRELKQGTVASDEQGKRLIFATQDEALNYPNRLKETTNGTQASQAKQAAQEGPQAPAAAQPVSGQNVGDAQGEPMSFTINGGDIAVQAKVAMPEGSYRGVYGKDGGILSFELTGTGVNSETGFKAVSGVIYDGAMNADRLRELAQRVATENAKPVPKKPKTEKEAKAKKATESSVAQEVEKNSTDKPKTEKQAREQNAGASPAETAQIALEFERVAEAAVDDGFQMHHLFDATAQGDVVRLQDKVKVYTAENGWMTLDEAKAQIAKWKAHTAAQGNLESNPNADKIVLSLFDLTGQWSKPWEEAGYQVFRFDIQDDPELGDVNKFDTEFFNDTFGSFEGQDIYAILAACPCTDFASSGARHFAAKDADGRTVSSVKLVHQTLATIEYFKPAVWAIENPVGRIEKLTGLPAWRLSFDPNHLGDPYTKKTLLWGRFNGELPVVAVEPTEGSKMHQKYGGKSQATKNARSVTPEGFAYGFFMANNAIDNPVMAIANKYDRLDRNVIKQAVDAGLTDKQIADLVDDPYYFSLDDKAAEKALRDAVAERQAVKAEPAPVAESQQPKTEREAKAAREKKAAPKVEKTATPTAESSANTEDAGAELTYNKRNRIKTGIQWSDIEGKDAALRVKETTKTNVYPRPDYQALVDGGTQPLVAHIVKQAYDSLATTPQVGSKAPTDAQLKAYIEGMRRYMDGVMAWANNPAQVKAWVGKVAQRAAVYSRATSGTPTSLIDMAGTASDAKSLLDTVFPNGWKENRAELILIGGNKPLAALQPSTDEAMKAMKDIDKGWPSSQEAWQKQGYRIVDGSKLEPDFYESTRSEVPRVYAMLKFNDGRRNITIVERNFDGIASKDDQQVQDWVKMEQEAYKPRFVVLDKMNRVKAWGMSQAEAEQQARDLTKRTGGGGIKDEGISVEMAQRTGVEHRMPGEDISSERLVETFGFKGVNFGNWMKGDANKAERQLHLNHVYDAFMDLAAIFDVPPKAMSLNGLLGIAVGAQGNGKYAAHFVPGVNEINLTRTSGAGSLAHEWGHALDHYFARQADLTRETEPFLTEHAAMGATMNRMEMVDGKYKTVQKARFAETIRPEIVEAFKAIVQTMNKRAITEEEVAQRREESLARTKKNTDGWLKAVRRDFESAKASDEVLAKVDALAERVRNLDLGDGKVSVSNKLAISQPVAEMRDLYKTLTGRVYSLDQTKGLQSNIDHLKYLTDDKQDAKTHTPQQVSTTYKTDAAKLDGDKGGKPYWSTNLEMFARAFDAYVSDKLEAQAAKNTYLSHAGRENETVPLGAERTAINEAIQKLVDAIESEETETGGLRIFSLSEGSVQLLENQWISESAVLAEVAKRIDQFAHQPRVIIRDRANGVLPGASDADRVSGAVFKNSIYLFRSELATVSDVQRTLFHELFHYGLRKLYSRDQFIEEMHKLYNRDAWIKARADAWAKTSEGKAAEKIGDANYVIARGVDEALARLAEPNAGVFTKTDLASRVLVRVTKWMADLAERWGFTGVAANLRGMKNQEARALIRTVFQRLETDTNPTFDGSWESSEPAYSKSERSFNENTRKAQNNAIQFFGNREASLKTFGAYDKTLSTQYNKALKDKHFGKVFGYVNAMQNEVSLTSIRPAELAPGVLPRVDDVKSAIKQLVKGKQSDAPLTHASQAIFDGTLAGDSVTQGKVWSEAEFMARPGATEASWALYKQARAAIDASLDEVAAAEAYAMAQGFVPKAMRRQIIDNPQQAQGLIANDLKKQMRMLELAIKRAKDMGAEDQQAELESALKSYQSTLDNIDKIFATSKNLKQAGYAPLMRFGKFTVSVQQINPATGQMLRDENGESMTLFFKQYETEGEAKAVRSQMEAKYAGRADVRVAAGTKAQTSHELYSGISPETLALFAEAIGADNAMRKYIELAMTERSALKRRLHRKGTEGYSEDLPRVLSSFITSNGRHAAQRYYLRDLNNAIKYIPKEKGDVLDEAIRLKKFVLNPNDPAAPVSSIMFAWFLGGSVASAIVNLSQPVMMTGPYLSQFGAANTAKAMATALPYAMGRKEITDASLRDAIKRASQEGIVDAQEIFHLYSVGAQGVASGLVNQLAKVPGVGGKIKAGSEDARARINAFLTLWGSMFAVAEGFNRKLTFIAAWEVAKANGEKNPYAFAVRAVNETQGIYNKVNRPNWGQGPVGRTLLTFKQYSIMYVELLSRMWKRGGPEGKRAALVMLAVLMLAAGEEGLPFAQDLDDLIDTVGQMFGFDTNMKRNKRRVAHEILGKALGDMFLYGVSPYLPLDFAGRLGMGNLIPGTAVLKPSNSENRGRDMVEVLGPTAGMATQIGDAYDAVVEGNTGKAVQNLAPKAVKDVLAAGEMVKKGYATDAKGRKVVDVGLSDAAIKAVGFNPTKVAEESRKTASVYQDIALQKKTESSIVDQWVRGLADNDMDMAKEAQQRLTDWNRRNPDTQIRITPDQIRSKARQMVTDKDARLLKQAPREMRGRVGLDLAN